MDKKTLRAAIRAKKQAMTEEEIARESERLAALLFAQPLYQTARAVYGYLSYNQEVRTMPILQQAQRDGKRVAVPKVVGDTMRFLWLDDLTAIAAGYRGIPEPIADAPVADDQTALVLMPGLAFTKAGARCGYGGGFYDRFLAEEREHPTVALCYDFQIMDTLPTDPYDLPVDVVLWPEKEETR